MDDNTMAVPPAQPNRRKFLIGGAVIALTLVGLVGWAMGRPGSTSFYYTTSEVLALGAAPASTDLRVSGKVVDGSIERDGLTSTFDLTDGRSVVTVTTDQPLPDTLKNGSDVVARGAFDGDSFTASEVLAKCPSKFKAKT
ncbi:MAG TPA: cytochrome c maturation protein CcmE [Actinomycetota bacterium]|nr:cytochrome c maturation protein CcmE [Actinomycetota bacterium]